MKEKETDQTTTGQPKRRARWRHHVVVTLLAVTIMTLFAIITIKVDYLAPVKRALAGFSFTDVYYQIETEGSDPDTCRYITIVDLTRVTERGQIAKVLRDIEAAHPKVIGMDCVFEGEGEDMEGNNAIVEVAEQYKNIVFAKKLQDWKGDSVGYTKATRSFFADFVDITEGTVNMPRLLYDNMKRKYPPGGALQRETIPLLHRPTLQPLCGPRPREMAHRRHQHQLLAHGLPGAAARGSEVSSRALRGTDRPLRVGL